MTAPAAGDIRSGGIGVEATTGEEVLTGSSLNREGLTRGADGWHPDALTSKRAYRGAYSVKKALEIMRSESGKMFDPVLLEAFIDCLLSKGKLK